MRSQITTEFVHHSLSTKTSDMNSRSMMCMTVKNE